MGEYVWNQQQSQGLTREPAWQVYERQQSAVSAARQPQAPPPPQIQPHQLNVPGPPSPVTPMPAVARDPRDEYERPSTGGIPREFSRQTLREAVPPPMAEEQLSPRGFARRAREAAAAEEAAAAAGAMVEDEDDGQPQRPWYLQGRDESRRPGLRPRPPLRVASGGR
jgi:hypothetical protein